MTYTLSMQIKWFMNADLSFKLLFRRPGAATDMAGSSYMAGGKDYLGGQLVMQRLRAATRQW